MTKMENDIEFGDVANTPVGAAKTGVINPFALAEQVAGRKLVWADDAANRRILETVLETPYEELFDPIHEGPLYMGLGLNAEGELIRKRPRMLDVTLDLQRSDAELPDPQAENLTTLKDLSRSFDVKDLSNLRISKVEPRAGSTLSMTVRLPDDARLAQLASVFSPQMIRDVTWVEGDDEDAAGSAPDWTPSNSVWSDRGRFFNEASEFFDPVQGAVANCYFIAAMSAVAWAKPYGISHMSRATSGVQSGTTNMIRFYKPDSNGQVDKEIEVTDAVPVRQGSLSYIYCRSSEEGEIWPAVYEKAFAKLETGHTGDKPDITKTGWGDPVWATAQLTGGRRTYWSTKSHTAADLYDKVRANSAGSRTIRPMVASTYSTGAAAQDNVSYTGTNLVASHAYTVLGWAYRNNTRYIVMRNPWGSFESSTGALSGIVWMRDVSWWRPIVLAPNDGTFAIRATTFKKYFRTLGVVS